MCAVSFFFWAVEDQRCAEALELGGHGHRNPPRCHADTRSDLDHDSGIPLQISTEIRTMYPNHVKRWGPHPERCPRLSRQAGQQGILTEPHMAPQNSNLKGSYLSLRFFSENPLIKFQRNAIGCSEILASNLARSGFFIP